MKITIGNVAQQISDKTGVKEEIVKTVVQSMTEVITESLARDKKVGIVNFGVYEKKKRKAHTRDNYLGTGKTVSISERYRVSFTPAENVTKRINNDK